uniref:E3 ubiquitin-protein ligase TRIM33 n=1 Tax=Pygocentrus nattereri TaxID=42514 RepID=A0AAR2JRJ7_PYGNA
MESEPAATVNGDTTGEPTESARVTEAAPKDVGDGQCGENVSRVSTPADDDGGGGGGESSDTAGGGEGEGEGGGGGEGEVNTSRSSPDGDGNRSVEAAETSGTAGEGAATATATATATAPAPAPGPSPAPAPATAPGPAATAAAGSSPAPPAEPSPAAPPAPATPINLLDTCAVCKQSLQNRDCEPKLLPCLHSFCLKCIPQPERQISVGVPGPHGQDTHIVNVMRCTVCYQEYKQTDMIDNYFVKDTTEVSSTSTEKSMQVCTSCEDNASAVGFCVECGEWLCKTCIEAHQRVKFTKDHTIRKKEEVSQESVGSSGQRTVFCPIHKQEALKLFCETCDKLTCRDCQLLEHKEHRYQFLQEAFQNQKGIIETFMSKLQEKKNFVQFSAAQVQNRLKEATETHRKVEHEIKIAVFTLINEINKKGKSLLQQLESVTKERTMKLYSQQRDIGSMAQQILHVLRFTHWAISNGSSTALLYSKRLVRHLNTLNCDRHNSKSFSVISGNLVIEKVPPPAPQPPNMIGPQISPGHNAAAKHPGQINLAQLRLQHMQQAAFAQKQQQHQQQHQHQQQIQQQMRIASQMSQHPRQGGPPQIMQQQVMREWYPDASVTPPLPVLGSVSTGSVQDVLRTLGENVKMEPQNSPCISTNTSLTNGSMDVGSQVMFHRSQRGSSSSQANASSQPGTEGKEDDPNEDWCAVCQNGGELLCCDRCPKVFHITCHIPSLRASPSGDWMCTFCRSLTNPEMEYNCDDDPPNKKDKSERGLSSEDQRKCERLLLYIFCHELSVEFQEPVPSSVPNYYKIIKHPMHLNLVKRKLQLKHPQHYQSPKDFVYDVRLVFSNCAKYNEADSEVAEAGKAVSLYFEEKLVEIYPDQSFPVEAEKRTREEEEEEADDDSDDDFVQPKRKRLKNDEKVLHIK